MARRRDRLDVGARVDRHGFHRPGGCRCARSRWRCKAAARAAYDNRAWRRHADRLVGDGLTLRRSGNHRGARATQRDGAGHACRKPRRSPRRAWLADPIIQAVATRLRAALRGWIPMSDLEAETLVRAAYAQVLRRHFGGREGIRRTLDARQRQRVVELVLDTAAGVLAILIPLSFSWARIGNLPVLCRTVPRLTVIEIASYFSAGNTTEWLHRPPDGSARCPQCRKLPRFREQPLVLSLLRRVLGEFVEAISDNQAFDST